MGFFPRPSLAAQLTFLPEAGVSCGEEGGARVYHGMDVGLGEPFVVSGYFIGDELHFGPVDWLTGKPVKRQRQLAEAR